MEITGNYNNYAGIYEGQTRQETAQTDAGGVGGEKETDEGGVYDKYINRLQKYAPDMKVRAGRGILTGRGKNPCTLTIHPDILDKIKNDPEKERYYADRLKDIERAEKLARSVTGADGFTTEYSHWYIDKDGKIWHTARTVRRDKLNEKLRREAQENAEKHIEATREKARGTAREKAEELLERTKEKAADRKEALQEMLEKAAEEMPPDKQAEPSDDSGEGGRFDMRI